MSASGPRSARRLLLDTSKARAPPRGVEAVPLEPATIPLLVAAAWAIRVTDSAVATIPHDSGRVRVVWDADWKREETFESVFDLAPVMPAIARVKLAALVKPAKERLSERERNLVFGEEDEDEDAGIAAAAALQ